MSGSIGLIDFDTRDPFENELVTRYWTQRAIDYKIYGDDNLSDVHWDKIFSTPSTINGYGISDAYTKTEIDAKLTAEPDIFVSQGDPSNSIGKDGDLWVTY